MPAPTNISAEPLDDGRIRIRTFVDSDAPRAHEAVAESLPGITQWMPGLHGALGDAEIRAWIAAGARAWADGAAYHFAIVRATGPEPDAFLGGVNLLQFNWMHRLANVSYWVRAGATGCGVATAATRLTARFAFERLALNRVEILMAPGNPASRRVAEKAGAHYEGLLRRRIACNGTVHDAHLFSLVPSDLSLGGAANKGDIHG